MHQKPAQGVACSMVENIILATMEAYEIQVEVAAIVQQETPVEVMQVQTVETITQIHVPVCEIREKAIPRISTQVVERVVEVPQVLTHEQVVEVPQIQTVEITRQEATFVNENVVREVPRHSMNYVERVQEVAPQAPPVTYAAPQQQIVQQVMQAPVTYAAPQQFVQQAPVTTYAGPAATYGAATYGAPAATYGAAAYAAPGTTYAAPIGTTYAAPVTTVGGSMSLRRY